MITEIVINRSCDIENNELFLMFTINQLLSFKSMKEVNAVCVKLYKNLGTHLHVYLRWLSKVNKSLRYKGNSINKNIAQERSGYCLNYIVKKK